MAKKSTQMRWIVVVGGIAFFGVLLYSTLQQTQKEYEVCVNFKDRSHCSTARGSTAEEAIRQRPRHRLRTNHQRARRINGLQRRPTSERPPSQVAVSGGATS